MGGGGTVRLLGSALWEGKWQRTWGGLGASGSSTLCQLCAPRLLESSQKPQEVTPVIVIPIWQPRENRLRQVKPLSRSHMAPSSEVGFELRALWYQSFSHMFMKTARQGTRKMALRGSYWTRGNRIGRGFRTPSLLFPSTQPVRPTTAVPPALPRFAKVPCFLFGRSLFCLSSPGSRPASFHPTQAPGSHLISDPHFTVCKAFPEPLSY